MEPDAPDLLPKMRVNEWSCRFLLQLPRLAAVHLSVTQEERAALDAAGLLADLRSVRKGACCVRLDPSEAFITEEEFHQDCDWLELDFEW